jgi:DNA-binding transcriptional ArsR family regulator
MPRAATTTDAFNAIAEPRRRDIIALLIDGRDHAVNDVVTILRLPQPTVSKHLSVLRKVGIVTVRKRGKMRLYRLNPQELKPIHDWIKDYERFWTHQISQVKQRAEQKMLERIARENQTPEKEK